MPPSPSFLPDSLEECLEFISQEVRALTDLVGDEPSGPGAVVAPAREVVFLELALRRARKRGVRGARRVQYLALLGDLTPS